MDDEQKYFDGQDKGILDPAFTLACIAFYSTVLIGVVCGAGHIALVYTGCWGW